MSTQPSAGAPAADDLAALRAELARLAARVASLEAAQPPRPPPREAAPAPATVPEGLSEELLLVLGAAVAAFLGKKPHIRQVQLIDSASWAHAGRVSIQASHFLSHTRPGASS